MGFFIMIGLIIAGLFIAAGVEGGLKEVAKAIRNTK